MPRLYLVADVINHWRNYADIDGQVNATNIGNLLCLQRLVSVVKLIVQRGVAFRDDENVGSPRKFFQKIFKT